MMNIHDQIGHGGGAIQYDIIGAQAQAARDAMGQRGGGGGGGGGRGGGFRGGFRGGFNRGFVNRNFINVPWWGWWPGYAPYAYGYNYQDACAALGRAVTQGAPPETIATLRAACAQAVYGAPGGYGGGAYATPFGAPGFLGY